MSRDEEKQRVAEESDSSREKREEPESRQHYRDFEVGQGAFWRRDEGETEGHKRGGGN